MSLRGCFVTGTDTNVGKTRISAGLLHWLVQHGVRAAGFKPVAAGASNPPPSSHQPARCEVYSLPFKGRGYKMNLPLKGRE